MILNLVCDVSGSMGDSGKPFIMRTAVMTVAQWVRLGYGRADIRLHAWASDVRRIDWSEERDYPAELLVCDGQSSGPALIEWLEGKSKGGSDGKVMLLSDGFWSRDDAKLLKQWKARMQPDTLRVVKIGMDANPQLRGPDVFVSEDLFAVLDDWLEAVSE